MCTKVSQATTDITEGIVDPPIELGYLTLTITVVRSSLAAMLQHSSNLYILLLESNYRFPCQKLAGLNGLPIPVRWTPELVTSHSELYPE
jgi:hypothetical protein